jgi:hypothetical protein
MTNTISLYEIKERESNTLVGSPNFGAWDIEASTKVYLIAINHLMLRASVVDTTKSHKLFQGFCTLLNQMNFNIDI